MFGSRPSRHLEGAAVSPRERDAHELRQLARETADQLASFAHIFSAADRRNDRVTPPELFTLAGLLEDAAAVLGEDARVKPLIFSFKDTIVPQKELNFDIAYRYLTPIVRAIRSRYNLPGSPHASPASKPRRRVDVRIDTDRHDRAQSDGDRDSGT